MTTNSTAATPAVTSPTNPQWFRQVLGRYPTGVALISSAEGDGTPVGMVVGTFTSVSLDPPLVAFLPAKTSTSWPRIRATGRFAVNVLGASQEDVCRAFSSKTGGKYDSVAWRPSESGTPFLEKAVARLDCTIENIVDAGDHEVVLGRVHTLELASMELPLLFLQGGYGKFTPHSFAVAGPDLSRELTIVDKARPSMEALAAKLGCDCLIGGKVRDEFVLLASAGAGTTNWLSSIIGQRVPAAAPFGRTAMAWAKDSDVDRWIRASITMQRSEAESMLEGIRARGFSITAGDGDFGPVTEEADARGFIDPGAEVLGPVSGQNVTSIAAPVLYPDGTAVLVLSLYGLPADLDEEAIETYSKELLAATEHIAHVALQSN